MDCPPILQHSWTLQLFKPLEVGGGFSVQCHHPLERKWSKCYITYLIRRRRSGGVMGNRKDTGKLICFKYKHFSDAFEIHILNAKENEQKNQQLSFE